MLNLAFLMMVMMMMMMIIIIIIITRIYVSGTDIYPHMPTYVHTPRAWQAGSLNYK